MSDDLPVRELLADYVLGLLEPTEAVRVDDALARSPELRAQADALRTALLALPEALEPVLPAPGSWETLRARVRAERPAAGDKATTHTTSTDTTAGDTAAGTGPIAAGSVGAAPPQAPRRLAPTADGRTPRDAASARARRPALAVALAVALALLVGTAGWGALQQRRANLAAHEEAVVAYWMRIPDLSIVSLEGVGGGQHPGVACVLPDGRAMVLQPHAPRAGRSYVLYGLTGAGRVELGRTRGRLILFRADGLNGVELEVSGPTGGVVAKASLN